MNYDVQTQNLHAHKGKLKRVRPGGRRPPDFALKFVPAFEPGLV